MLTKEQIKIYQKYKKPWQIQDFLNTIPLNFTDTYSSPKKVIEQNKAQCVEGALLAASILKFHGHKPLIMDLRAKDPDVDHVVAVFEMNGYFGSIGKTNHVVLRYRDPVYKNPRELALSFFHEYFLDSGKKTMYDYSNFFDLTRFNKTNWETSDEELEDIIDALDSSKHNPIVLPWQRKILRKADPLEIEAGKLVDYKQ